MHDLAVADQRNLGRPCIGVRRIVAVAGEVLRDEEAGVTFGRPVGVTVDPRGALLIADDLANIVWRVSRVGGAAQPVDAVPAVDAPDDTAQPGTDASADDAGDEPPSMVR